MATTYDLCRMVGVLSKSARMRSCMLGVLSKSARMRSCIGNYHMYVLLGYHLLKLIITGMQCVTLFMASITVSPSNLAHWKMRRFSADPYILFLCPHDNNQGALRFAPVCPSVCLSVRPSVCLSIRSSHFMV